MRLHKLGLLLLLLLLGLPLPGRSFDGDAALRALGLVLLGALAGLAALVGALIATSKLLQQLGQPEATTPAQRRAAGWRIVGLTPPATVVVWGLLAWLTYDAGDSLYYPAVPLALLLGLVSCLLLRWRRRPTAAKALLAGLLAAGTAATVVWWLTRPAPTPPVPLGLLGNPTFADAPAAPALANTARARAADVGYAPDRMPGFRGSGAALTRLVQAELQYPDQARAHDLSGVAQLTFVVQPTGGLGTIRVAQSLSPECDAEAVRVLKLLAPRFLPGSQGGLLVPMEAMLSFGFGPH